MMRGFTLLEVLIIIAIIIFLAALIFPLSLGFYKSQQLESHTQGILQTLRQAQLKAMSVEQDSSFGVYITNDNYILFRGESFVSCDSQECEIYDLPQIITIQDVPKEVVFSKFEGRPNPPGNIVISSNGLIQTININAMGRINLE